MIWSATSIEGLWLIENHLNNDNRGTFFEWYRKSKLPQDMSFEINQVNVSFSRKNTIRGIHYSLSKKGQDKWITCLSGEIIDVVVDLRVNSPTFGKFQMFTLSSINMKSLFVTTGLGHSFISKSEISCVSYLLSSEYDPEMEYGVNPLDKKLSIPWSTTTPVLSQKDHSAPTIEEMRLKNLLPKF